jgi:hypothetical protein
MEDGDKMSDKRINKELPIEIKANDKDRTITAVISKEVVDRDGDIIRVKGIQAKHWMSNPVILANHVNQVENVIGKGVGKKFWVSGDEAHIKFQLAVEENPLADMVWKLYKGGFLKTMSLSFLPNWDKTSYVENAKKEGVPEGTRRVFNEVEMLEATVVPLPSNRAAFMKSANDAWEEGVLDGEELNWCEEIYPEETKQVNEDNDIKAISMAAEEKITQEEMEELLKQVNDRDTKIMELELQLKEQELEEEEQEFDSYLAEVFGEFDLATSTEEVADGEQTDEEWAEEILTTLDEDE